MKIDIRECLKLLDEKNPRYQGHTNAIISMVGEDIAATAFKHYSRSITELRERRFYAVGFPPGSGPRLDRWFYNKHKKLLYQCEIKSWCAWAITAWELKHDASRRETLEISNKYWGGPIMNEFKGQKKYGKTSKILMKMKKPDGFLSSTKLEALLILWFPISSNKNLKPFFSVKTRDLRIKWENQTTFKRLHFFSVSLYLRSLLEKGEKYLKINAEDMSDTKQRLTMLEKIII